MEPDHKAYFQNQRCRACGLAMQAKPGRGGTTGSVVPHPGEIQVSGFADGVILSRPGWVVEELARSMAISRHLQAALPGYAIGATRDVVTGALRGDYVGMVMPSRSATRRAVASRLSVIPATALRA